MTENQKVNEAPAPKPAAPPSSGSSNTNETRGPAPKPAAPPNNQSGSSQKSGKS